MTRTLLKSKIHRATVTEANLEYEGSVTIDEDLLRAADILPYEAVDIWDGRRGAEFVRSVARGNETVPTVTVGKKAFVNPTIKQLHQALL